MTKTIIPLSDKFTNLPKESQTAYIDMLLNAKEFFMKDLGYVERTITIEEDYDQKVLEPLLSLTLLTQRSKNTYFIHATALTPYIKVEKESLEEKGYDQVRQEYMSNAIVFPVHKDFGKKRQLHATHLTMLLKGKMTQKELAQEVEAPLSTVKRHIASLKKMGLVENPGAIKPFVYLSKEEAQSLLAIEKKHKGATFTYCWLKANVVEGQGFYKGQILGNWGLKPDAQGTYNTKNYKELDAILEGLENAHLITVDRKLYKQKNGTVRSNTNKGQEPALNLVQIGMGSNQKGETTVKGHNANNNGYYVIRTSCQKKINSPIVITEDSYMTKADYLSTLCEPTIDEDVQIHFIEEEAYAQECAQKQLEYAEKFNLPKRIICA